jgi:hypothetical protein
LFEPIKLDPLVNQRVIFKLHAEVSTMDATILGYDDVGYWVKGGTLAEHLKKSDVSDSESDIRYLEIKRIQWLQRWPGKVTYLNGEPV